METKLLGNRCDDVSELKTSLSPRLMTNDGITIMHTSTTASSQVIQSSNIISTPSMKAMIPLPMDDLFQHNSSTESARDQQELGAKFPESPRKSKPSKIPLPGSSKSAVNISSKPPSGRPSSSTSGPHKSLTKSTGSLYTVNSLKNNGPSSISKRDLSLTRPDSIQSLRNSNSIDGTKTQHQQNRNSSSSIPISQTSSNQSIASKLITTASPTLTAAYGNTTVVNIPSSSPNKHVLSSPSPVLRSKRDSLTSRVKNLDSLSRLQSSSSSATLSPNGNTFSGTASTAVQMNNVHVSNNSQTMVTSSIINSNSRKYTALPVRRMTNVSTSLNNSNLQHQNIINSGANNGNTETNGGKVRNIRSSIWNWLKI